ncbi:hypothetical protein COLO4_34696 [Corchorus olitorius]|uniref:Uncharacterized protein n=1 Tax=Corchorus olitorius TaxID=93759 RepID=A0A1R3GJX1_9ROSI|nr:hypothetical protein COLO4_34696 [Corchorus olitorius]
MALDIEAYSFLPRKRLLTRVSRLGHLLVPK